MEEQFLFAQIHDALDIPTPPGAFERLRTELTKKPVRPRPWPVFQMRTSSMGFKLAAGLAVVAIAVAAAAAVLAIHNSTENLSPAGPRMSIAAYQKMVADDNTAAVATYSAPCGPGEYTGCGADASRGIPAVQKWINDLSRGDVPTRFAVINEDMKQFLLQNISAQHDLLVASTNNDRPGMDRAFWIATLAPDWLGTVLPAIAQSRQVSADAYVRLVRSEVNILNGCSAACGFNGSANACMRSDAALSCQMVFDGGFGPAFAGFSGDLVKEAAPESWAVQDARLQNDLLQANVWLMTIRVAIGANDQTGFNLGLAQLVQIKSHINLDASKITG